MSSCPCSAGLPLAKLLEPRLRQVHDRRAVANGQPRGAQRRRCGSRLRAKLIVGAAKLGRGVIPARAPVPVVDEYLAGQAWNVVNVIDGDLRRLVRTSDEVLQRLDLLVEFGDGAATRTSGIPLGKPGPDPRPAVQRLLTLHDHDQAYRGLVHSTHSFSSTGARSSRSRSSFAKVMSRTGTLVLAMTTWLPS